MSKNIFSKGVLNKVALWCYMTVKGQCGVRFCQI